MTLTGNQKRKWLRLKQEIIKRPFLAYKIGLTTKEIENVFSDFFPNGERIEEVDGLLIAERDKKIERLRPTLTAIVGHRGSVQFADKVGTDGMTIKYIIDKKSRTLSHDLISDIEIFLSYISDFEVSIENQNDANNYIANRADRLKLSTMRVANRLNALFPYFDTVKQRDKKAKKPYPKFSADYYEIEYLQSGLTEAIAALDKIKLEIDTIIENLLEVG